MRVKGLARERHGGFAYGLILCGVSMNQGSDVIRVGFPTHYQFALTDLFTDPRTNGVEADDGSIFDTHQLDDAVGAEDVRLAVAGQVVLHLLYFVVAVLFPCLIFGQTDGGDLRLRERDTGDDIFIDWVRVQARDVFSNKDSLQEPSVCQL